MASSYLRHLRHLRRLSTSAGKPSISISKAKAKLRYEHDPDKALEIYSSVSVEHFSPTLSLHAQNVAVQRLAKSRRFSDIESLIESVIESRKNDKIKDEPFHSTLIRSYGRAGMFEQALKTFDQMDDLGIPRSVVSFNSLLTACNYSKRFDKVPQLFDEIPKKYNFSPDRVSYGILVKSYCEQGLTDKAIEVVGEMDKAGVEVTAVTFTTVLDALYRKNRTEEAEKWWDTMTLNKGIEIDSAAHNARIGHCHGGDPEKAKALIEEMTKAGLKPDTVSFNYLMTCFFNKGMIKEAKKVYDELERNGCSPNVVTFRTMVHNLCEKGDFDRAHKVFKKSAASHKIPGFDTTKALVEGLVKKKKIKEAKGVLRTVKKRVSPGALASWKTVEDRLGLASKDASKDAK